MTRPATALRAAAEAAAERGCRVTIRLADGTVIEVDPPAVEPRDRLAMITRDFPSGRQGAWAFDTEGALCQADDRECVE